MKHLLILQYVGIVVAYDCNFVFILTADKKQAHAKLTRAKHFAHCCIKFGPTIKLNYDNTKLLS